jgi:hypothetical protein
LLIASSVGCIRAAWTVRVLFAFWVFVCHINCYEISHDGNMYTELKPLELQSDSLSVIVKARRDPNCALSCFTMELI